MSRWCSIALVFLVFICGGALSAAPPEPSGLEAMRSADARLAAIAYRLTTANAALCRDLVPRTGLVLHASDQYAARDQTALRQAFGFEAPVSVEAVVPDTPASRSGVDPNDGIVAIDGESVPPPRSGPPTAATRDAAQALIARAPAQAPLRLTVEREGVKRDVTIGPVPGCPTEFEVLTGHSLAASADGAHVQIGATFLDRYDDAELAAIVAHELAHNILRHRARLKAAGVGDGIFAEFGRSGRLTRKIEDQADAMSVYLLYNAGYDPKAAVKLWRDNAHGLDGGLFRSRTHASAAQRAAALAAEIARIPNDAPTPYIPPLLATRDQPLQ